MAGKHPGRVLIVQHGPGRGRIRRYMRNALDFIRWQRPEVFSRLAFHATGDARPNLREVTALVFWLADPLRQRYPECYAQAAALQAEAVDRGIRVVNPPDCLSRTMKSEQAGRWLQAAIPTPRGYRFEQRDEIEPIIERVGFPCLVRADEEHAQVGIRICYGKSDLADLGDWVLPGIVTSLIDTRQSYRGTKAGSIWERLHHKKRILVLGERLRTEHLMFSSEPVVSAKTSLFRRYKWASRLGWNPSLGELERACVEADIAYWRQGSEHDSLMRRAVAVLGLEYAAIDYCTLADGSPLLWEANPYFCLPKRRDIMLPRLRFAGPRLASFYSAIADFLLDLAIGTKDSCTSDTSSRSQAA